MSFPLAGRSCPTSNRAVRGAVGAPPFSNSRYLGCIEILEPMKLSQASTPPTATSLVVIWAQSPSSRCWARWCDLNEVMRICPVNFPPSSCVTSYGPTLVKFARPAVERPWRAVLIGGISLKFSKIHKSSERATKHREYSSRISHFWELKVPLWHTVGVPTWSASPKLWCRQSCSVRFSQLYSWHWAQGNLMCSTSAAASPMGDYISGNLAFRWQPLRTALGY